LSSKNHQGAASHGQLFLVRHLLLLKEMTANLDFELSEMPLGEQGLLTSLTDMGGGQEPVHHDCDGSDSAYRSSGIIVPRDEFLQHGQSVFCVFEWDEGGEYG
jgi:hypothetical protein